MLVADQPYYAPDFSTIGARISYRRKIFGGKVNWRLQLNVRNLLDDNTLFANRAVDRRDGTGGGAVVRLAPERTSNLPAHFRF
ncbi:MAG: hypothetical protein WDM96_19885 [Lacunisphaera sp.]